MKYIFFLERNKQEVQKGIILVVGKHMNRTALGIVDAILTVYPNLSFEELKEMLPDTINPSAPKNYKSLFAPYNPNRKYGVVQPGSIKKEAVENGLDINASHFTENEETFITSDGIEVLVNKSWETSNTLTGENDLQNLIDQLTGAVKLTQSVQAMVADGATEFTEVGPGKVLQGLVQKIFREAVVNGVS